MNNRVLVLSNNYYGLWCFRFEVIRSLIEEGYKVYISVPCDYKLDAFEQLGCEIIDTQYERKGKNPVKDFILTFKYYKIIKKNQPDVVLSYTIKPNIYGGIACQICRVPQIVNITGLGSAVEKTGWLQKLTVQLYKLGLRKACTVFIQNSANMDFCKKNKMVHGKLRLIPGSGVNLEHHAFQTYPSEEPLRFIFIGRLLREKGIEHYFKAAHYFMTKYTKLEFHIVGLCEESYESYLKQLQEDKIVIYHGPQADVRPYIGQSCCTIHPSFYPEGMSNVLLESCAAGRPIITTDRSGCKEVVDDGINGFIVKQQDTDDLIKKIEMFINLPYEKKKLMGIASRKKVESEFDRNIVVNAYLDEVKEAIARK